MKHTDLSLGPAPGTVSKTDLARIDTSGARFTPDLYLRVMAVLIALAVVADLFAAALEGAR